MVQGTPHSGLKAQHTKGMEASTEEAPMEKDLGRWVGAVGPKKAGLTRHHPGWVQEIMTLNIFEAESSVIRVML